MECTETTGGGEEIKTEEQVTNDQVVPSNNNNESSKPLSKRQLKRLRKRQMYLSRLPEMRAKQKIKRKLRKLKAKEENIKLGPSKKELKKSKMSESKCKLKVALDFSFDQYMSAKDICKCIQQVLRCYSSNRRAEDPMQFYVVNFNGPSKDEMAKHTGYQYWDVNFHSEGYLDLFPKESIVYLTSDSNNVIESLDHNKVYIIGALVDHNSLKGLCYKTALEKGIGHGRLPIKEHVKMKTRNVLAINHVFDVLLNICNGMSWTEAFLSALPPRKGASVKSDNEENDVTQESER